MALQWVVMAYVVGVEAALVLLLTLPSPKPLRWRMVAFASLLLQPSTGIVPFAAFHLLDIYWKNENRLMCKTTACTADERDRYDRSIFKSQKNAILCASAILLYLIIYRICEYNKEIKAMEEAEKRLKEQ